MRDVDLILESRHKVATAAGSIARVAAQISRALAWQNQENQDAALLSNLDTALVALSAAQRELHEAFHAVRIATREE